MNQAPQVTSRFEPAAADQMEKIVSDLGRMYQERNEALQEVARAHHEALFRLSVAAEYKDDDTGEHIVRIGFLAEMLALHMGKSKGYALMLRRAAPMHDIGKIGIPDRILLKPGPLEPEEFERMKEHAALGRKAIEGAERRLGMRVRFLSVAKDIAYSHHERWDGTGYPENLAGDAIPVAARLMALADVYDALIHPRVYRPAVLTHEQACTTLVKGRGSQFDPDIVDAFIDIAEDFRRIARNYPDPV